MPGQYSRPLCADGLKCDTVTLRCVMDQQGQQQGVVAGSFGSAIFIKLVFSGIMVWLTPIRRDEIGSFSIVKTYSNIDS